MKPLKSGKFYRTVEGHYLWKTDKVGANLQDGNKQMTILLPNSLVLFTKFGKFRYLQVVYEELVGYIWCNTNLSPQEHLEPVDTEDCTQPESQGTPNIGRRRGGIRS